MFRFTVNPEIFKAETKIKIPKFGTPIPDFRHSDPEYQSRIPKSLISIPNSDAKIWNFDSDLDPYPEFKDRNLDWSGSSGFQSQGFPILKKVKKKKLEITTCQNVNKRSDLRYPYSFCSNFPCDLSIVLHFDVDHGQIGPTDIIFVF